MLAASCAESARQRARLTCDPFHATRRSCAGSGLAYQLASAANDPTSAALLRKNAAPRRSGLVYAKRLLRTSSWAALTTKTAEASPLAVERPVCSTVLFQSRARAAVVPVVIRMPCWKRPCTRLYCTVTGAGLSDSTSPNSDEPRTLSLSLIHI